MLDYTNARSLEETNPGDETPLLGLGGSVDGPASLGWGLAESYFYPISAGETVAALEAVADRYTRIWHYRLYDTVSDPAGLVRGWLDAHTTQRLDLPYPGRDYLRVQLFETPAFASPENCPQSPETTVTFGDELTLRGASYTAAPRAGSTLYATLCWQIGEDVMGENLRTSLARRHSPGQLSAGTARLRRDDRRTAAHRRPASDCRSALAPGRENRNRRQTLNHEDAKAQRKIFYGCSLCLCDFSGYYPFQKEQEDADRRDERSQPPAFWRNRVVRR